MIVSEVGGLRVGDCGRFYEFLKSFQNGDLNIFALLRKCGFTFAALLLQFPFGSFILAVSIWEFHFCSFIFWNCLGWSWVTQRGFELEVKLRALCNPRELPFIVFNEAGEIISLLMFGTENPSAL